MQVRQSVEWNPRRPCQWFLAVKVHFCCEDFVHSTKNLTGRINTKVISFVLQKALYVWATFRFIQKSATSSIAQGLLLR